VAQGLLCCLRQCSIEVEGEEVDEPVVKKHCADKSGLPLTISVRIPGSVRRRRS
jgi:hypothetical protein